MLNHVHFEGFVTNDIILKSTEKGTSVVAFAIGVPKKYPDKNNKYEYIPVVAYKEIAEEIAETAKKGNVIEIVGNVIMRKYKDFKGVNCSIMEVLVDDYTPPKKKEETA